MWLSGKWTLGKGCGGYAKEAEKNTSNHGLYGNRMLGRGQMRLDKWEKYYLTELTMSFLTTGKIGQASETVGKFFSAIGDAISEMAADEYPMAQQAFTGRVRPVAAVGAQSVNHSTTTVTQRPKVNVWFSAFDR